MSILKFQLTEQHIALAKHMDVPQYYHRKSHINKNLIEHDVHEEFGLILFGKPEGEFDISSVDDITWSEEQKAQMWKLFDEMDTAIQIMFQNGEFKAGNYKAKHHIMEWQIIE